MTREVRRLEEDCLYSGKGHFNAADRWAHVHLWLGIPAALLAALAGASAWKNQPVKDLSKRRSDLNLVSPQIPGHAYRKAKKGIAAGEATYSVDIADGNDKPGTST